MLTRYLNTARGRARRVAGRWSHFAKVALRFGIYLRGRKGLLSSSLACSVVVTLMSLLEPWPLKLIIDNVLLEQPLPSYVPWNVAADGAASAWLVAALALAILLIAFARGFFYYIHRVLFARLGIEVSAALRHDLYRHIQYLPLSFHSRRRTGDLIVRLTSDVRMLRNAFTSLPIEIIEGLLLMTGIGAVMLWMDWQLGLAALVLMPLVAIGVRKYRRPMKRAVRKQREREGNLATMANEALGAIKVVQMFRRERHEIKRFSGANKKDMRAGVRAARYEAKLRWSSELAVAVVTAAVVLFATNRILAGSLSVGELVVFLAYLRVYVRPLRRISRLTLRMTRSTAAGERVLAILDIDSPVQDAPGAIPAPRLTGEIMFDAVSLNLVRGETRRVLADINLHIEAGERVAIVGPTGAGKTSLVELIARFYDPSAGSIRVDGFDLRELTLDSLRRQVSIVFQEPVLFAATIAENIAYGRSGASQEDIVRAAQRAQVHRIIEELPQAYETPIGERGATLSGGQRQCIAIARAMIRSTPIVILDEPTTGLDPKSAKLVIKAMHRLMRGRTVIMITHDMDKISGFDRVISLRQGKFVADESGAQHGLRVRTPLAAVGV